MKLAKTIIFFNFIVVSVSVLGVGFLVYLLIFNPESIGEWFGRLVDGFKSK